MTTPIAHQASGSSRLSVRLVLTAGILAVAAATIAGAWGFELIGGFIPCKLCLQQRLPYYVGVPLAALAVVAVWLDAPIARILVLLLAAVFAVSTVLGGYHAGVEWGWWPGPADCGIGGAAATTTTTDLLQQLESVRLVSCTEATWRFPAGWGLSFAGWNTAVSVALTIAALAAARPAAARR